jgi:hypothetical protein
MKFPQFSFPQEINTKLDILKAISKTRLRPDGLVAGQLKMYGSSRRWRDSAFSLPCALPSNLIQIFEMAFSK